MNSIPKQEIIFVTGKGGVGKSAVAAALAKKKAESGRKTLLVELGFQSFYQDFLKLSKVEYHGTPWIQNCDVALWSGPEALKEYARHLLKVEALYKIFFENPITRNLLQVAPALPEIAVTGKITSHPRKVGPPLPYDTLVIDAFATGHFLALLKAPRGMAEAIRFGPMGEQSRSIQKILTDPEHCQYFVVSFPEELPVQEGLELGKGIEDIIGIKPKHVMNKVEKFPEELDTSSVSLELKTFQTYLKVKSEKQKTFLEMLRAQGSVIELPQVFETEGLKVVDQLKEALP